MVANQKELLNLQESGRIYEVMSDVRQHKAIDLFLNKVLGKEEEAEEATVAANNMI